MSVMYSLAQPHKLAGNSEHDWFGEAADEYNLAENAPEISGFIFFLGAISARHSSRKQLERKLSGFIYLVNSNKAFRLLIYLTTIYNKFGVLLLANV